MARKRGVRRAMLGLVLGAIIGSGTARADDKQQCVIASEKAQQLRNAGKLSAAREQLVACGRTECPKLVQQDCTEWMKEVLAILPTVVPGAKDRHGKDVVDVTVSIDGTVVTRALDGKAIPVDPGVHTLRFEPKQGPAVEEQVVIRQGEKNRIVTVTVGAGDPPAEPKPVATPTRAETGTSSPIAAYVTGAIGVVALGAALYLLLDANADARTLRETCAPNCAQSDVDDIENRQLVAGVTAGLGGAALVAGAVLFFTHQRGASSTALRYLPGVTPLARGGIVSTGFRF